MPYPCVHCGRMKARTSKSRCSACNEYKRRTGQERPFGLETGWKAAARHAEETPGWKGDDAHPNTKRARARRRYPLGPCVVCGAPGVDRHHKDEDTGNNAPENIAILCRLCHMKIDGRLEAIHQIDRHRPKKLCLNCGRPSKPLRKGRCHACHEYLTRRGRERPYHGDGRHEKTQPLHEAPCVRCGRRADIVGAPVRGYCKSCYRYIWEQEREISSVPLPS